MSYRLSSVKCWCCVSWKGCPTRTSPRSRTFRRARSCHAWPEPENDYEITWSNKCARGPDMNCHDAQTMMHGFLDGELDPSVSLQYQQHVGACPACSKALAEQQAIQATMKADSLYFKA